MKNNKKQKSKNSQMTFGSYKKSEQVASELFSKLKSYQSANSQQSNRFLMIVNFIREKSKFVNLLTIHLL